jgi:hypothetical protein
MRDVDWMSDHQPCRQSLRASSTDQQTKEGAYDFQKRTTAKR